MLFAVGTKVKFLHTGDRGTVTGLLDDGMVNVLLRKEDMEIPAYPEDLIRDEVYSLKPVKAKIVAGKKEPTLPKAPEYSLETQYFILKSVGVQVAFLPLSGNGGSHGEFEIFLLNDTRHDTLLTLEFRRGRRPALRFEGKIAATSFTAIGKMQFDDLNESPEFEGECRWVSTEGVGSPVRKSLKIKPKIFFSGLRTAPLLNKQVHLFKYFEKPGQASASPPKEDLRAYTKRNLGSGSVAILGQTFQVYDTAGLASFNPELDLHIEKLEENWRKLGNGQILRIQLAAAETFLFKAIQLGVPKVFLIHGVGEGVLRDAIAARLRENPEVKSFINQYHHKYGWGATEVHL